MVDSVTALDIGVEGRLTLSSWGGPQSISGLGKQLKVCPGLSQPDVLNKPVNLPPVPCPHPQPAPMADDHTHVCAVLQAMGLTKLLTSPQKGLLFSAVISPFGQDRWRHCTSVYRCKGEGEGRSVQGRKVLILCWRLPVGWHLALTPVRPTGTSRPQPLAGKFYFHGKPPWVTSHKLKIIFKGFCGLFSFFKPALPLYVSHSLTKIQEAFLISWT